MNPLMLSMENEWAVEAVIRSFHHVYQLSYQSRIEELGGLRISHHDRATNLPAALEFHAVDMSPLAVHTRVQACSKPSGETFLLNVFHPHPVEPEQKAQYLSLGYEFVETVALMGLPLPIKIPRGWTHVYKVESPEEIEFANQGLALGGEHIAPQTFEDPHIANFYAQLEHRAVGWAQMVTVFEEIGCITQLYTLPVYRQRGIGTRLLRRAHQEANRLQLRHVVLLASSMGMSIYRHAGYEPLAYLSVFRPQAA